MKIGEYDYHFIYTVGAFCDIADLHLAPPKTVPEQCKTVIQMAVIMSKAYEDKQKLNDPSYEPHYLTLAMARALSVKEVIEELTPEVDGAVKEGSYRTVEAQATKKKTGAVH